MGRAAVNEQIKLRATFFNNLGVGLTIAGGFIPYFAFTVNFPEIAERIRTGPALTTIEIIKSFGVLGTIAMAFFAAFLFRRKANRIAGKIQGD